MKRSYDGTRWFAEPDDQLGEAFGFATFDAYESTVFLIRGEDYYKPLRGSRWRRHAPSGARSRETTAFSKRLHAMTLRHHARTGASPPWLVALAHAGIRELREYCIKAADIHYAWPAGVRNYFEPKDELTGEYTPLESRAVVVADGCGNVEVIPRSCSLYAYNAAYMLQSSTYKAPR